MTTGIIIISTDLASHQVELLSACLELGLEIRPVKYTSLHFTRKKMYTYTSINLVMAELLHSMQAAAVTRKH